MGKWTANLKIQQDGNQNPISNQNQAGQGGVLMAGPGETVTFENLAINDQCTIRFAGPVTGVYRAHRVWKAIH
jgi:hypothetical protein